MGSLFNEITRLVENNGVIRALVNKPENTVVSKVTKVKQMAKDGETVTYLSAEYYDAKQNNQRNVFENIVMAQQGGITASVNVGDTILVTCPNGDFSNPVFVMICESSIDAKRKKRIAGSTIPDAKKA